MKPNKEVTIAVGLCERDGKFLFLQRKHALDMWDQKWEFPGGKLENDETPEQAVIREVQEETGLTVLSQTFFLKHQHDWDLPNKTLTVHLHCFHVQLDAGEVIIEQENAHQYRWCTPDEALELDSLDANHDILNIFFKKHAQNLD